jgi:formate dehydrogenase major subunit
VYLLPAATQFETSGSCTASNRSLQWREKVIEPLWESRSDHMIMHQFADKLGFGKELSRTTRCRRSRAWTSPWSRTSCAKSTAASGPLATPARARAAQSAHAQHACVSTSRRSRQGQGKDKETGYDFTGDYFGLPWPCYGTPELKHPGSPNLYDTDKHVMDGGGNFRANFGVERDGENLLAEDGSHSLGADITTGYPELRPCAAQEAGLVG